MADQKKYQVTINVNELQQEVPSTDGLNSLSAYYGDKLSLTKVVEASSQTEAINQVAGMLSNLDLGTKVDK